MHLHIPYNEIHLQRSNFHTIAITASLSSQVLWITYVLNAYQRQCNRLLMCHIKTHGNDITPLDCSITCTFLGLRFLHQICFLDRINMVDKFSFVKDRFSYNFMPEILVCALFCWHGHIIFLHIYLNALL